MMPWVKMIEDKAKQRKDHLFFEPLRLASLAFFALFHSSVFTQVTLSAHNSHSSCDSSSWRDPKIEESWLTVASTYTNHFLHPFHLLPPAASDTPLSLSLEKEVTRKCHGFCLARWALRLSPPSPALEENLFIDAYLLRKWSSASSSVVNTQVQCLNNVESAYLF